MGYYDWANNRQLRKQTKMMRRSRQADRYAMRLEAQSSLAAQHPPAGWYADQADPLLLRWWDGAAWTMRTAKIEP
jgi:hypothetical protein